MGSVLRFMKENIGRRVRPGGDDERMPGDDGGVDINGSSESSVHAFGLDVGGTSCVYDVWVVAQAEFVADPSSSPSSTVFSVSYRVVSSSPLSKPLSTRRRFVGGSASSNDRFFSREYVLSGFLRHISFSSSFLFGCTHLFSRNNVMVEIKMIGDVPHASPSWGTRQASGALRALSSSSRTGHRHTVMPHYSYQPRREHSFTGI